MFALLLDCKNVIAHVKSFRNSLTICLSVCLSKMNDKQSQSQACYLCKSMEKKKNPPNSFVDHKK